MRRRDLLFGWVVRPVTAVAWAFIFWGTLLLLATLWRVVTDGPLTALALLMPDRGDSFWAWLNLLTAVLALLVWLVVIRHVAGGRRSRR